MVAALQYLEAAKIEELTRDLTSRGYSVATDVQDGDVVYDLVASNGGQKVAIEVQAYVAQPAVAEKIKKQRQKAHEQGYDYQLFLVNPPREREILFDELDLLLARYLSDHLPNSLAELAPHTSVKQVSRLEINTLHVSREGLRVTGTGVVELTLDYGGEAARAGISLNDDYPFAFDLMVNHDFEIGEVTSLVVDTAS